MKRITCIISLSFLFSSLFAQTTLLVTADKTTSLVFPFSILHVDRGTKDILVQAVKEVDNILFVKAGCANFHPTNLSVITADGSIYSFLVSYDSAPSDWVYHLPVQQNQTIESYANAILDNAKFIHGVKDETWGVKAEITGVYVKNKTMFFQLVLTNETTIDYDIDYLRFYIRDKKKGKRTASQENELKPVYTAGNTKQVTANNKSVIVTALDKFTIPDAKYLAIEAGEKNGGRTLKLRMKNRKIIKATSLPDLK